MIKRSFEIFIVCVLIGWTFRLIWDLNHIYGWIPSGDFFFGVGYAVTLLGCAMRINLTVTPFDFNRSWKFKLAKSFSSLFLYTAVSNICDELFFDPYVVSWQEWATALGVFIIIYLDRLYGRRVLNYFRGVVGKSKKWKG